MDSLVRNATRMVEDFSNDSMISPRYFELCHGIVLISAVEVAFFFSGNVGTGILLRHDKKENKWSPPCAIGISGVGAGAMVGLEKRDIVMFLSEPSMVKTLSGDFQLKIGMSTSLTLGKGEADDFRAHFSNRGAATTTLFALTKGACAGVSLEGGVILPRTLVNKKFYGDSVLPKKILFGQVNLPEDASIVEELHKSLDEAARKVVEEKVEYKDEIPNAFLHKPNVNQVE